MKIRIILKKMSYENSKHRRILKSCLTTWFSNPKELHLTNSNMTYPFKFNQWMTLSYKVQNTETWVAFLGEWVVGMISLKQISEEKRGHLFHLYINKQNRNQGFAQKLIRKIEEEMKEYNLKILTLNVVPGNSKALALYKKMGFTIIDSNKKKLTMSKNV
ncbi:MAG TPA: GNAT family N-acetyltransferase [Candidatus Marinimicrobia bacterium]|nr:GNAT family N-acetyltransferase [Candidatus Neomarinimicrobiota bacterium]|tara:strand:- start:8586 stop:9065 length:480 start_codon:yes stop_codon:yes gene_type:complete